MAQRGKNNRRKDFVDKMERPARYRRYHQLFLIVCEDEATEPAYFQQFKDALPELPEETLFIQCVGTGLDPLGVVQRAIYERNELARKSDREVDFVWTVFDKDDADLNDARIARFEEAFALAATENINVALSNECFELWLLLHFTDVAADQPIPRQVLYDRLAVVAPQQEGFADFEYKHGKPEVLAIVKAHGDEAAAIDRAETLRVAFKGSPRIEANPSTDMDLLVTELRSWIKFYSH
jgi:hypothetical protein